MGYNSNLDLLRALAVILIVVEHTLLSKGIPQWHGWQIESVGQFGINLFTVHSALVLMGSLERRPDTLDFYIRRVFRLYPLAVLLILFTVLTHARVGPPHFRFKDVVSNCLLTQELFGLVSIDGVMWALPPEVYLCLLLPCCFFFVRAEQARLWPLLVFWLLMVRMDVIFFPDPAGYNFPVMFPDFLSGMIAYAGFQRRRPILPTPVLLLALAALFCLSMTHLQRPHWIVCLALGLLLPFIRFPIQSASREAVRKNLTRTVAVYSYAAFLIHPFCIVLGFGVLGKKPLAVQLAAEGLSLLGLAYAAHHWVEQPMIRLGDAFATRIAAKRGVSVVETLEQRLA